MGYILTLGPEPNTYTGFRAAAEGGELPDGEQFVTSLEGWTEFIAPRKPSGAEIIEALKPLVNDNLELLGPYIAQWAIVVTALQIDAFAIALATLNSVDAGGDAQIEALKAAILVEIQKGI